MINSPSIAKRPRELNGFPPTVCVELLKQCNMACPHCRSHSSPHASGVLNLESVVTLLDGLARVGDWRISLTGGEPSLWDPLPSLLAKLQRASILFSVTTNGSASSTRLLKLPSRVWETGTLKVSIDGSRELHDSLRGVGSFDRALAFLRLARPLVQRLCVNTTLVWDASLWVDELHNILCSVPIDKWSLIAPIERAAWTGRLAGTSLAPPYSEQFARVNEHITIHGNRIPLAFLDYASLENRVRDVIYVNADGHIELPGFLDGSSRPVATTTHIEAVDAIERIARAAKDFEATGRLLQ